MNKIYRVIRNHNSGQTQAVYELAKSCSGKNRLVKIAIATAIAFTSGTVFAGGDGGGGGYDKSPSFTGADWSAGSSTTGEGGHGGLGGNGGQGAGGIGGIIGVDDGAGNWIGGNGQNQQGNANAGRRGGGGGGGTGRIINDAAVEILSGNIIKGGDGGNGDEVTAIYDNTTTATAAKIFGKPLYLGRGGGGGGGAGLIANANVNNAGLIQGGNGGFGAAGGGGGAGVIANNITLTNSGEIKGGDGGLAKAIQSDKHPLQLKDNTGATVNSGLGTTATTTPGFGGKGEGGAEGGFRTCVTVGADCVIQRDGNGVVLGPRAIAGAGAAGVVGSSITLINSGTIKGGLAGKRGSDELNAALLANPQLIPSGNPLQYEDVSKQAENGQAIWLKGGTNKLVLKSGSDIQGAIQTDTGATTLTILENGSISGLNFTGLGANTLQFTENLITRADNVFAGEPKFGNSFVNTTLNGDLTLNNMSTVNFRLDGLTSGSNDKLTVNGNANLGGAKANFYLLNAIESDDFAIGNTLDYTIMEVSGAISGEFMTQPESYWFTDLAITNEGGAVKVSIKRTDLGAGGGESGGENGGGGNVTGEIPVINSPTNSNADRVWQSVAKNTLRTDSVGWISKDNLSQAIRQVIFGNLMPPTDSIMPFSVDITSLTVAQRQQLLGTASMLIAGEIHPTATTAMKNKALTSLDHEFDKTRYNLMSDTPEDEWPLWIDFHTAKQDLSGDLASSAHIRTSGVTFGGDVHMGTFRLGASVGYDNGNLEMHGQPGNADTRTMNLAMYGGTVYDLGKAKVNWMSGFNYQQNKVETERVVAFANFNEELSAKYDVDSVSLATEVGYQYPLSKQSHIEPFLNLAYHKYSIGDIAESELSSGLRSRREGQDVISSKVGTRVSNNFQVGTATGNVNATLAWRHNMGDTESYSDMTLIGNGATFQTRGIEMDENAMIFGAGTVVDVGDSLKLGLNYNGEFGSSRNENAAKVDLRWTF